VICGAVVVGPVWIASTPLRQGKDGEQIGTLSIGIDRASIETFLNEAQNLFWLTGLIAVLAGLLLAQALGGAVAAPVEELVSGTRRVAQGDLNVRFRTESRDELSQLGAAFNEMVAGLQERERLQQELNLAREIQRTLLPRALPALPGWQLSAHYQPAREVGGDFYDFIPLPDSRLGLVIGDVAGKGVPAALVMATARSLLRAAALRLASPGAVLEQVNDLLHPDIAPKMFVTCLYAVLDPASGHLQFANAGHDLPYQRRANGVTELRARGMPLGALPGMRYEEREIQLAPADCVLFYTDGLVEAHNARREMFGFPRLKALLEGHRSSGGTLIPMLLDELRRFTGGRGEQEDDVALVVLERRMDHDSV